MTFDVCNKYVSDICTLCLFWPHLFYKPVLIGTDMVYYIYILHRNLQFLNNVFIITTNHSCFWHFAFFFPHTLKFVRLSNILILSVPEDGYFERTWWRLFWAYLMKVILSVPDEGYFERTWWRLFWAYLMRVILSVPDEVSRNASCALNLISKFLSNLNIYVVI
jgi:hypothetical protein